MTEIKKDNDAGDRAPKPVRDKKETGPKSGKQDASNYDTLKDGGRSVPTGDMNSANDE